MLGDATVSLGKSDDGKKMRVQSYRLRAEKAASASDLDEYLSDDPMFLRMLRPSISAYTRLEALAPGVVLAEDSYVFQISEAAWHENLQAIGAVLLPDSELQFGPSSVGDETGGYRS